VIEISIGEEDLAQLEAIGRSRTAPASWVERARILLAYRSDPSTYAVGEAVGVTHQTVKRCLDRAVRLGVMAALDDSPRPGKAPEITAEAKAWLVSLACQKAKDLGYPHELWTTRLLARHVREHAEAAGHPCVANIAQGTVCKILARNDVKPHKVRYYLERRDEAFEAKMDRRALRLSRGRGSAREPGGDLRRGDHLLRREARHPGDRQYRTRFAAEAGRA
jgi:transposase